MTTNKFDDKLDDELLSDEPIRANLTLAKGNYLAFYIGRGEFFDYLVRWVTLSPFSHVELVTVEKEGYVFQYSSSPRDNGVRCKVHRIDHEHWHYLPLSGLSRRRLSSFYKQTKGAKYDWIGAIASVIRIFKQHKERYFCSEWIAECLKLEKPHRLTPKALYNKLSEQGQGMG